MLRCEVNLRMEGPSRIDIADAAVALFPSGWITYFWIFFSYFSSHPTKPNAELGLVRALANHGSYVYVSDAEATGLALLKISGRLRGDRFAVLINDANYGSTPYYLIAAASSPLGPSTASAFGFGRRLPGVTRRPSWRLMASRKAAEPSGRPISSLWRSAVRAPSSGSPSRRSAKRGARSSSGRTSTRPSPCPCQGN
jgi:hypothetical protein